MRLFIGSAITIFICSMPFALLIYCAITEDYTLPYKDFKLETGKIISCKDYNTAYCGQNFEKCKDGQNYDCMVNVQPMEEKK